MSEGAQAVSVPMLLVRGGQSDLVTPEAVRGFSRASARSGVCRCLLARGTWWQETTTMPLPKRLQNSWADTTRLAVRFVRHNSGR